MLRPSLRLLCVAAMLVATAAATTPTAAAPVQDRTTSPADPVVYLPECHHSEVIPAGHAGQQCPGEQRTVPEADCFTPLPGDYALVGEANRPGQLHRRGSPRPLVEPRLPKRMCTDVVPAVLSRAQP